MTEAKADVVVNMDPNAAATAKPDAAPKVEKIEVGGKSFEVPADVAAAINSAITSAKEEGQAAAKEVEQRLRAEIEAGKPKPAAKPVEDYDTLLFTDPKAAVARIKAEVRAEVEGTQLVSRAQDQFWTNFYEQFPELKGDDLVVKALASTNYGDLRELKIPKAIEKLGEMSHKYLVERGVKREKTNKKPTTEGGNEAGKGKTKTDTTKDAPSTGGISSVLRERREARAAARRGGGEAKAA